MSIAGVKSSSYNSASYNKPGVKMPSQDSYETNLRKQITQLEDKMNSISNDEEKTKEQKTKEKQAAREQIQNLSNELRQYEIEKRQEEAEKKQEAVKQALEEANANTGTSEAVLTPTGLGDKESGVMISLSATKDQIAGMVRIRRNLEGKQRTADTEEEKAAIQKKINNLSRGIGQKVTSTKDTISEYHKTVQNDDTKKQPKAAAKSPKKEEVFWTDTKPANYTAAKPTAADSSKPVKDKPFDNASIVIS